MKWIAFIFVGLLLLISVTRGLSQCQAIDFDLPTDVCQNERILITHDLLDGTYYWDFCAGDLNNFPTAEPEFQIADAVGRPGLELIKEGDTWFGFITGTWTNSLQRLEFGNGLDQLPTDIDHLGNLNGMLNNPGQIRMIDQDGIWYGIIHNTGSGEILKVTFGNQLSEVISVSILTTGVGYINSGLALGKDPVEGWIGIISESDNTFSIIRFGNDLHPSTPDDIIVTPSVPNPNNLGDVDLINICGEWFGAAVNLGGGNTYLLSFGQNLFSVPQIDQMVSLSISNGARLRFAQDGEEYFLLIASLDGIWHKLKFGTELHNNPIVDNEGDLNDGLQPNIYGLAVAKENSIWTILSVSQANGQVYRVNYPQNCSAAQSTSTEMSPLVSYTSAGTYTVSLNFFSEGQRITKSKIIAVSGQVAPDINFLSQNICVDHDVFFTPLNLSGDISEYNWNFGDLTIPSNVSNPSHQYDSDGQFEVSLEVIAENGCRNYASNSITIYPEPVASFTGNLELICTNNEINFLNSTTDTFDGNLSYQWFVNNDPVSTDRDLQYSFTTTGPKEIKLQTSIPGCADEIIKTTSLVEAGPVVDFSFTGVCEDETFNFKNEISESVETYSWDFDDGQTSTDPNPTNAFSEFGDYSVSLTATNTIGCHNKKTKIISVRSKPIIDFAVPDPPYSCSGTATQFYYQSINPDGGEVTTWLWDFGDTNNPVSQSVKDPEHIFEDAGIYNVSLSSTTEFGCEATGQKEITITQSPSTDFTFTPACDDLPVIFNGPSGSEINEWYWEIGTAYYLTSTPTHTFRTPGDYPVYLNVTSSNGCRSTAIRMINVPEPLNPDFSFIKNCIDQETIFTDITDGEDPIVSRQWDFWGIETSTLSPASYSFNEGGIKTIQLKVTAQSGCKYLVSKQIDILPSPVAGFSASPPSGAPPLEVQFINTSSQATQYLWRFSDGTGSTSTEVSPAYTFHGVDQYEVELTASNTQQCEDTFRAIISTVAPLPDVDLEMISISRNPDGSFKLIVTINNKGNTVLKNLPVDIDFSGAVKLRDIVEEPIRPASKYNLVFSTGITNLESLRYVCVSADLMNDLSPQGNRICKEFENILFVFPAYPNPAKAILNLEWIAEKNKTVRISLSDSMGRNVLEAEFMTDQGLNQEAIDLSTLQNGIYNLIIDDGFTESTQRILISGKP